MININWNPVDFMLLSVSVSDVDKVFSLVFTRSLSNFLLLTSAQ